MGQELRRAALTVVRLTCGALLVAGAAALALLLAAGHLPALLATVAQRLAPDVRLEVGAARLDARGRLELRRVRLLRAGTRAPVLEADRVAVHAATAGLSARRLHAVRLRAVAKDVVVGGGPAPPLRARGAVVEASLAGLSRRRHVETVRLVGPRLAVAGAPGAPAAEVGAGAGDGWTVGRLLVSGGRLSVAGTGERPRLDARVTADLRDLGGDGARAARSHQVTFTRVTVALPGHAGSLAADEVRVRASLAGLAAHRVDELALRSPLVTAGDAVEPVGRPVEEAPGGPRAPGPASAAWTVARVLADDGRLDLRPSAATPGVRGGFRLDLRDVGLDPAHAERLHHVEVRDVRVRYPGRPESVVVDAATVAFTMAGLRDRRELARFDVARGLVVLDRDVRERLAGNGGGARPDAAAGIGGWSIAQVDVGQLGIRLSDLGDAVPDVTLLVRTRLRDVPLGFVALREARQVQRVELSNITLNSPLDAFRPVVHVGSLFAEFTLAELLHHRIARLTVVSPTIYLGEDLVWFKDAAGRQRDAPDGGPPWTVRRLRAELGRIVVTYNGLDRATVPLAFRTEARNVVLGDLAALRLAAALEVPRQDYRFPALGLDLLGVEGELRFDFPPDGGRDNVVNTLRVDAIRWRDYRITGGWFSATFDQRGINGTLGGSAYAGYVNGGLSVPYDAGTMAGWAACTGLDLAPLAATVAGTYLAMEGVVDVRAAVETDGARIERADARLDFTRPGVLRFPSLDALRSKLPAGAPSWQHDLLRAAVQAFAEYPYASGGGTLAYVHPRGEAHLTLAGARGRRRFDINYRRDGGATVTAAAAGDGR